MKKCVIPLRHPFRLGRKGMVRYTNLGIKEYKTFGISYRLQ